MTVKNAPMWAKRNLLEVASGQFLQLQDGSIWEVSENPKDGIWVIGKNTANQDAQDEMILFADVAAIMAARPKNGG